ncbi:hypothetical protein [Roseobacter sp. MH60115]|uniref:hypothetical protein n=1 Tax=Roseobacter sp. MH60115 TaxID=2785324 RepID=UPI0018A2C6C3|nr:hypothetical protein [Roseobacter sp. MH60115]
MAVEHHDIRAERGAFIAQALEEFVLLCRMGWQDRSSRVISAVFLATTTLCLAAAVLAYALQPNSTLAGTIHAELNLGIDNSLSEKLGHGLAFLAAALFVMCHIRDRSRVALFLAVLCAFIWFDDTARYHERLGSVIAEAAALQPAFGLRGQDLGELAAWYIAACLLAPLLAWAVKQRMTGDLGLLFAAALCFGALVIFGVVIDMAHIVFPVKALLFLEDGGELITLTGFCILAVSVSQTQERYFQTN